MTATLTEPIAAFTQGKSYVNVFASQDDLGRAAATQAADVISRRDRQRGRAASSSARATRRTA
jgi:hypothetical protein